MKPVVLALPGNADLAGRLASELGGDLGQVEVRRFPDGESYVRIETEITGRPVVLAATLDRPDDKLLPLLLVAGTARDLDASSVGLAAPYLPYMRQDRAFHPGEAESAYHFAHVLSGTIDWLVTVDPHLHRIHTLREIYSVPVEVVHAGRRLGRWIQRHVPEPVLVGPDEESRQWVGAVAAEAGAPWTVLTKRRRGDYSVDVTLGDVAPLSGRTPVLVDDIVSTGRTMVAAMGLLAERGCAPPYCVAVHGIFADGAYDQLLAAGARAAVTTNTVPHPTNAIDVLDLVAGAIRAITEPVGLGRDP